MFHIDFTLVIVLANFSWYMHPKYQVDKKKIARLQKAPQNTSHRLSGCQIVLFKRLFVGDKFYIRIWVFEFGHNWFFFNFVTISGFEFVTIWVVEFCPNLSCWVLPQFELLSFVKIWVEFVTVWAFEICHNGNNVWLDSKAQRSFEQTNTLSFCPRSCCSNLKQP